jgi:hypothetical protein
MSFVLLLLSQSAFAGSCDGFVSQAASAKGEALIKAYTSLAKCDVELARREVGRFLVASGDLETLVPMAVAAIDAGAYNGLWTFMDKVPYQFRDTLARDVGTSCVDHPGVMPFLQGAWTALKGSDFTAWQAALSTCKKAEMTSWLEELVKAPPVSSYNDKYNAAMDALVQHRGIDALSVLEVAAVAAGKNEGPFNNIVETIQRSIQSRGSVGAPSAEAKAKMEETLVRVAKAVPAANARIVADRLVNAGSEQVAAALLPAIFPDRVQSGDKMLWAAAAVESCDGQAVIHWASWTEAPKRWAVVGAVTEPLRASKPALKCDSGTWPVIATEEPLTDSAAAQAFVEKHVGEWTAKGMKVKAKQEKVTVQ